MNTAVPFQLKRSSSDLWNASGSYTTTTETAYGLVRLDGDRLVIQWRRATITESMGGDDGFHTTDEQIDKVKEVTVPLHKVAGAVVLKPRLRFFRNRLVITAADLLAFEQIAGEKGLKLRHPAKLELRIKRADRLTAEEFAAELSIAVASLPVGSDGRVIGPGKEEK